MNPQRKYLCFLDIDGVLASNRVHMAHNADYMMWHRFDPVAVDFFNMMHDSYDLEFVLMSTWKNHLSSTDRNVEHWVLSAFGNSGFRGAIANPWKTNPNNDLNTSRGKEVKHYLETCGRDVEDYILFDDNRYDFKEVLERNRLVVTDADNGLLFKHMLNAKSLMGNWREK